jgi:hypothetical protein
MEQDPFKQQLRESQLQVWERMMYVALGSAVAILFHVTDPLRDIILMVTLLYTTLSGFYLLGGDPWRNVPMTESRARAVFGHLFASWLVALGIFSYSLLPPLGLAFAAYTVFLLAMYWRTCKMRSASEEIFP